MKRINKCEVAGKVDLGVVLDPKAGTKSGYAKRTQLEKETNTSGRAYIRFEVKTFVDADEGDNERKSTIPVRIYADNGFDLDKAIQEIRQDGAFQGNGAIHAWNFKDEAGKRVKGFCAEIFDYAVTEKTIKNA